MAVIPRTDIIEKAEDYGSEDNKFVASMLLPTAVIFAIGILIPIGFGLILSFFRTDRLTQSENFVFFSNYFTWFSLPDFWHAYYNTILFTVVTVTFELFLGLIFALILNKAFRGRGIVRAAILIPWAMPTIVNARLWEFIFRPDGSGLANDIFTRFGLIEPGKYIALANAARTMPINLFALIFTVLLVLTFLIIVFNSSFKIYQGKSNEILQSRAIIVSIVIFIISFVMVILAPLLMGFDELYYYGGLLDINASGLPLIGAFSTTFRFPTDFIVIFIVDIWKTTPFMALLILASLQTIPDDLYKASQVDGASTWQQFRHITLPLLLPGIGVALIFRCIDAFRIYDILTIFISDATESITVVAVKEISFGRFGQGAAVAVFSFINILIFTILFFYLTRRRDDE